MQHTDKRKKDKSRESTHALSDRELSDEPISGTSLTPIPGTSMTPPNTTSAVVGPNYILGRLSSSSRKQNPRRSKALRKAYFKIRLLERKVQKSNKNSKKYQKRYERLLKKKSDSKETNSPEITMTPRTKTRSELRSEGVSPRQLPRSVVKKLELSHAITSEIKDCVKTNSTVKRSLITKVLAGRLVKKYRCKTALKKSTGLSLNSISEDKTIKLVKVRRNHAEVEDMKKKVAG